MTYPSEDGLVPWCSRCKTWHDTDEDHWDEIEAAAEAAVTPV